MAFSKVANLRFDDDDEDDRERRCEQAEKLYKAAQEAQQKQGCTRKVLAMFRDAEDVVRPLLDAGGGLTVLGKAELEMVLKGRLYQAVILARQEDCPDRWPEVRALVEDVLHFDASNCHANWLRGLALLNGTAARGDAEAAMRKAVECARSQGKDQEADQWESELKRVSESPDHDAIEELEEIDPADLEASDAPASAAAGPASADVPAAKSAEAKAEAPQAVPREPVSKSTAAPGAPLRRGFLNRGGSAAAAAAAKATAAAKEAEPRRTVRLKDVLPPQADEPAAPSAGPDPVPRATSSSDTGAAAPAVRAEQQEAIQRELDQRTSELRASRAELGEREAQLEALRAELASERQRSERASSSKKRLLNRLDGFAEELDDAFAENGPLSIQRRQERGSGDVAATLETAKGFVLKSQEAMKASKDWDASQHGKYTDFATELATLREMFNRELRDRQDFSRQHLSELRGTTKALTDLRSAGRSLRESVKAAVAAGSAAAAMDAISPEARVWASIEAFRALPAGTKACAFASDAVALWTAASSMLLGALCALALLGEGFGAFGCRLACAP